MRHFVFLQGMPCSFYRSVGEALERQGQRVSRINLSFGDWLYWHGKNAVNYRGRRKSWPDFLKSYIVDCGVTDLVLLGEQRKYHKEAVLLARDLGVRVMATDFGYFRPDWITLEPNGMGGNSTMPKNPEDIIFLARKMSPIDFTQKYQDSGWRMSVGDFVASFGDVLLSAFFPHYEMSVERPHPLVYFPAMGQSLLLAKFRAKKATEMLCDLQKNRSPYFVFPLQLDHDFQIRAYSPYPGMTAAVDEVLASFANHAPKNFDLWIKVHPWDPGLINWKAHIQQTARRWGIQDRVHYLEGGDLDGMMANAAGVVTVNSTSGLKALQLGRPVQVLGQAVYDVQGLTHGGGLNAFWTEGAAPDPQLLDAFVKLLVHRTQIRGVFFHPEGRRVAVEQFVQRLLVKAASPDA